MGDSNFVVSWLCGDSQVKYRDYQRSISNIQNTRIKLAERQYLGPPEDASSYWRHICREGNTVADKLSRQTAGALTFELQPEMDLKRFILVQFDGACSEADSGAGAIAYHSDSPRPLQSDDWEIVGRARIPVKHVSSTYSEVCAAMLAELLVRSLVCKVIWPIAPKISRADALDLEDLVGYLQ